MGGAGDAERQAVEFALYRVSRRSTARDFQVFELGWRQGWGILRIARVLGMNPWVVWMIRRRLGRQMNRELAKLQACRS